MRFDKSLTCRCTASPVLQTADFASKKVSCRMEETETCKEHRVALDITTIVSTAAPSADQPAQCCGIMHLPDDVQQIILGALNVRFPSPAVSLRKELCNSQLAALCVFPAPCSRDSLPLYDESHSKVLQACSLLCASLVCSAWRRQAATCPDLYCAAFKQRFGSCNTSGWWPQSVERKQELSGQRSETPVGSPS